VLTDVECYGGRGGERVLIINQPAQYTGSAFGALNEQGAPLAVPVGYESAGQLGVLQLERR